MTYFTKEYNIQMATRNINTPLVIKKMQIKTTLIYAGYQKRKQQKNNLINWTLSTLKKLLCFKGQNQEKNAKTTHRMGEKILAII